MSGNEIKGILAEEFKIRADDIVGVYASKEAGFSPAGPFFVEVVPKPGRIGFVFIGKDYRAAHRINKAITENLRK